MVDFLIVWDYNYRHIKQRRRVIKLFDTISSCMQRHKMLKLREIWDIRMLQSKGVTGKQRN